MYFYALFSLLERGTALALSPAAVIENQILEKKNEDLECGKNVCFDDSRPRTDEYGRSHCQRERP